MVNKISASLIWPLFLPVFSGFKKGSGEARRAGFIVLSLPNARSIVIK